ncbi:MULTISPECIES: hypothetical protein [unclassified Micromonospora]|uniref:hypothetical protein n=1 Tax=unclassified Micromonospora TaxID=2617518 RepID=UPI00332128D7
MDAEAARRPRTDADGPRAGADRAPAAARDRLRAAVLAGSALTALVAGGWWWQTSAPATGPLAVAPTPSAQSRSGNDDAPVSSMVAVDGQRVVSVWTLPGDGGASYRVDPRTGAAFRVDSGGRTAVRIDSEARRLNRLPNTIWRERATLNRENGRVVKQAAGEAATRFLLQYRCTGPGELLVVLERVRSAAPFPAVECDGTVVSIELTAVGGPFRVSLSTADAEPLRVDAQLVALP